ncbi:MAG TPA: YbjQ family protein [Mycobacteriales bacterium]|nr:YbjQ family protein [Mycobacteriales bacterium]
MSEYFPQSGDPTSSPGSAGGAVHISTSFDVPGTQITRYCGSCFGVVVRSMGFAKGIGASFKALAGGEVTQYTRLLEDSRRHAMDRMVQNAQVLGANAVIGMRFDSSEIGQSLTEIVAYGTAVVVEPAS